MRALFAVALSGCSAIFGLDDPQLAIDASGDGSGDLCVGEGTFKMCVPRPVAPRSLSGGLSTDTGCPLMQPLDGVTTCMVTGTSITIAGDPLTAYGKYPLVLIASNEIVIQDALSVASATAGMFVGAGANAAGCPIVPPPVSSDVGSGGGAGGSFGARGGSGGAGAAGQTAGAISALTGGAPTTLRGGCSGGPGGGLTANPPGVGGGAVYLAAGKRISIAGKIDASGGGGYGGAAPNGGGSGGGSGGMIALWAPMIDFTGILVANGGGGGGGAVDDLDGGTGGDTISFDVAASGGLGARTGGCGEGAGCGGIGGVTGADAQDGGDDVSTVGGGGGGGGGSVGVILVVSGQRLTGNISPSPVAPP
jgi:hypothetical protein